MLETNMTEIMLRIEEQNKIEKEEVIYYVLILICLIVPSDVPSDKMKSC